MDPIVDDIKRMWAEGKTLPQIATQLHLKIGFVRCVLQTGDVPNAATDLVETIMILHSIFVPAAEIARRLKVDQATVLHILTHGKLPQRQLSLAWKELPADRPLDDEVGR
ncbi:hypothetical protein [Fuerstiella marisgermanici]|uniref:Uncharacterized protein n=1 Tax=Fuerstiella marisgermanici TaxID=1891926 RepID=A0A1P8W906_9PLAN|nr:hypothetical protein [Fuerstiella marisgermanici]APZ90531.1 hypothetical protein Fuma_00110 [Fuerstiella marisgermanici]